MVHGAKRIWARRRRRSANAFQISHIQPARIGGASHLYGRVYSALMCAAIFGPDLFVVLIFVLLAIGIPIWTLVDVLSPRSDLFIDTALSKTTWIGLAVGQDLAAIIIPLMRIVTAGFCLNYLFRVRPKLKSNSKW